LASLARLDAQMAVAKDDLVGARRFWIDQRTPRRFVSLVCAMTSPMSTRILGSWLPRARRRGLQSG
jgi:hypothetical protein